MRLVRYYPDYRSSGLARSPWTGLEAEIDRLFTTALTDLNGSASSRSQFPVDLYEDGQNSYVRAQLPGVKREDIAVETADGVLSITASRKEKDGEKEEAVSFSRSVSLPQEVQSDRVAAAYEDGVLTVTLPKREEAKPKKVSVVVK